MVLLHVLHSLATLNHWGLTVAHFNHQLRGGNSDADQELVMRTAQVLGLPTETESADVREWSRENKVSLEMAARELRHQFLARTARRLGVSTVALAHHADDQLELFLLRLLRGSGGSGLTGMKNRSFSPFDPGICLVRPLLLQPKAALHEYAAAKQIAFREDASNESLDIQRNRVRHELLPLLRQKYQPALDKTLRRVMDLVGAEAEFVTQVAGEWLGRMRGGEGGGNAAERASGLCLEDTSFARLPVAVQRRCLQLQLWEQGIRADYELVEQLRIQQGEKITIGKHLLVELMNHGEQATVGPASRADKESPVRVFRDAKGLICLESSPSTRFVEGALEVDLSQKTGKMVFDGVEFTWRIFPEQGLDRPPPSAGQELFDAERVGTSILLRHWQPGDRFQPIGMKHAVKLQDLFVNQRVSRVRRHQLIVAVTASGEVFWVEDQRISEQFRLTKNTNRRLLWRWQRL